MQRNNNETTKLLLSAVHDAHNRNKNMMATVRDLLGQDTNDPFATLLSYDLQAGRYTHRARTHNSEWQQWCQQLAAIIKGHVSTHETLLEIGCGEATTLGGVLTFVGENIGQAYGFDNSWSRVNAGNKWLAELRQQAELFVADLFNIPFADSSIDIVYSSHSLEPNGGRENEAIKECLRVARKKVILIEPIYELAGSEQKERMRKHGYVRGLKAAAEALNVGIDDYRLLDFSHNPLNQSGVLVLRKKLTDNPTEKTEFWQCPITGEAMEEKGDVYHVPRFGIVYPVLRGVPLLRPEHAVIASKMLTE